MAESGNQNGQAIYLGRFQHTVSSNRIKLPSKWRQVGWPTQFLILPWPIGQSNRLLVLTQARWLQMLAGLRNYSLSDENAAAGESLICAAATESELDESGRLALPALGALEVGIDKQVELVGRNDKFEVWDPARYAQVEADYRARAGEILKKLHL